MWTCVLNSWNFYRNRCMRYKLFVKWIECNAWLLLTNLAACNMTGRIVNPQRDVFFLYVGFSSKASLIYSQSTNKLTIFHAQYSVRLWKWVLLCLLGWHTFFFFHEVFLCIEYFFFSLSNFLLLRWWWDFYVICKRQIPSTFRNQTSYPSL